MYITWRYSIPSSQHRTVSADIETSNSECRYYGLYRDESSDSMAGIHSLPLKGWYNFGKEGRTLSRTFFPNLDDISVRYVIPGWSLQEEKFEVKAQTTLGNELLFTASKGRSSIQAVVPRPDSLKTPFRTRVRPNCTRNTDLGGTGVSDLVDGGEKPCGLARRGFG